MAHDPLIRRAMPDDAARGAEIHVFGWRCAYKGIIGEDVLLGRMSVARRADALRRSLEQMEEETWVYDDRGIVKGMLTIGECRDDDKDRSAFELWGLYVEPTLLRSGIGSALIAFCEEQARTRGRREVLLWVLEANAGARAFYEKRGYAPDGSSKLIEKLGVVELRYRKDL